MKSFILSLTGLATLASGIQNQEQDRPVSKVVTLIQDMIKQLEKEAEEDEDIYDKLACWCETYDKEKTKSVADNEGKIRDLTHSIEELSAQSGRLNAEIKVLKGEIADDQAALDQAKVVRANELKKFNEQDKELSAAIEGLNVAIQSSGGAFVQKGGNSFLQASELPTMITAVKRVMRSPIILEWAEAEDREKLNNWLQNHEKPGLVQESDELEATASTSDEESVEVLKKLKQLCERNLEDLEKDEAHDVAQFEEVKKGKFDEIKASADQVEQKKQTLADTDQKLWDAKEDLDDTKESLTADEEFIVMLKGKCANTDAEWEARSKTRMMEIEACHKALSVLNSDEAHALFSKTFNPAFLQTLSQSKIHTAQRTQAAKVLSRAAEKTHNPKLAALSMQVRLDAFTRVKKAIDDMIVQLTAEKNDEIKHKDFCIDEFNQNQVQTEAKDAEKVNLIALIEDLNLTIKTLTAEIDTLKSEVKEANTNMKRASEDREKETAEFQQTVADQRASQKLLKAALEILKGFYEKKDVSLTQMKKNKQAPPPGFSDYKKSGGAGGVIGMIENIITDAKAMEADATRSEEEAVNAYNTFVSETTKNIGAKNKEIVNKSEEKAKAQTELNQATSDKENAMMELEQLSNYNAELHQNCDFVMKNFEMRQEARDEEIEALRQAKGILSGSKFGSFLQQLR